MSDDYIDGVVVQSFNTKAWSSGSAMLQPVMVCEAGYGHLALVMMMKLLWLYFNIICCYGCHLYIICKGG
jgi:threonine/homoserine/homoserine lactone efflux protein